MKGLSHLYCLTFPNGKMYIGQTSQTPLKRFTGHKRMAANGKNTRLYAAWRAHGDPVMEVLYSSCLYNVLKAEFDTIVAIGLLDESIGYNMIDGGSSSPMLKKEIANKVSATRKANPIIIRASTAVINSVNADENLKKKIISSVSKSWLDDEKVANRIKSAVGSTEKRIAARWKTPCTCNGEFFKTVGAAFIANGFYHPHSAMVRAQIQKTGICVRIYNGKEYVFKLFKDQND